jgi:hypothetical protein
LRPKKASFSESCFSDPKSKNVKHRRKQIYEDGNMNVSKTIKCFRDQEKQAGELLLDAVCRGNKKNNRMHRMLICGNPLYLSAVNTEARIKWGTLLIRGLFEFFNIPKTESEPQTPVFL